ncbi:hypothetical protein Pan54_20700 [Rubinisphaera italica]|uniref:Uncharacterized protein n=1 Tax=Rubinisphaera italica TaxID=2527969 RepID=A0A5C5XEW1_9PLAN|nr:hypothetical protein Pan54_20700 [Rubinisphaera italica]
MEPVFLDAEPHYPVSDAKRLSRWNAIMHYINKETLFYVYYETNFWVLMQL